MELNRTAVLCLLWIFRTVYAHDFYVVAPSALRLNYDENVAIAYDGSDTATAIVKIQDHPRKEQVIFEENIQVQSGKPQLFKVNLKASNFKDGFLLDSTVTKLVYLNVHIHNLEKEILIPISNQAGYMFIQSAKPIYDPKEQAWFRIIPLTEDGVPSTEAFKFQIKNPQGVVVDEKLFKERRRDVNCFEDYSYSFPKYPILGEWKAIVYYGNNLKLNTSVSFDLKEYVLPTFTVKIETPGLILPTSDSIPIKVEAEYVYKIKVKGVVSIRLAVRRKESSLGVYFASYNTKLLKGVHTHLISKDDITSKKIIGWFPDIEGSVLVVEATVVDEAGEKVVETDLSTRFSSSPYVISFKRCLNDFRPGFPSIFEADISDINGKPAAGVPTRISAEADNGELLDIDRRDAISSTSGIVSFEIFPENHHKTITFMLKTNDSNYDENQAIGTFTQRAYQSESNAYIAISRMSPIRLQPGEIFTRYVHSKPNTLKVIYYLVLAKGKILSVDKMKKFGEVHRMSFPVTYDMVPGFRVVAFAHYENDLIADSLKFETSKICSPGAEVILEPVFTTKHPGSSGKIVMKGTNGTAVGLLGVDDAVYALSKKGILTRENVFNEMDSHDLGCGPGGGTNINSVLEIAGITIGTNKFTPSPDHSCVVKSRRRRRTRIALKALLNEYEGKSRDCCQLGLQIDSRKEDCRNATENIEYHNKVDVHNCSDIVYECCLRHLEIYRQIYYESGVIKSFSTNEEVGSDLSFLDIEDIDEQITTVRRDFREILINKVYTIGQNGTAEEELCLPHSITTWVIQAVSVNPTHGICVSEPKEVVSFQNVFLQINIPYSIKLREQVEVEAAVFNYGSENITASVYMYGVDGLCSTAESGKKSESKYVHVGAQSAETVTFSIIPLREEDFEVKFVASTAHERDAVLKTLHVVPQGIKEERGLRIKLDPTNQQGRQKRHVENEQFSDDIDPEHNLQITTLKLTLPNETVPGTAICIISATGDLTGTSVDTCLKDPDSLIKRPKGCGEQNLVTLAPTVYTMRYLKATKRLTPERYEKGMEFIRLGYDNQLKFKKEDGSYSVWSYLPSSTWLTAFVLKVFCQADEFLPIDEQVISFGLKWLVSIQSEDGSFIEHHKIYHREMMESLGGPISMTAFALITLAECENNVEDLSVAKELAVSYLEQSIFDNHTPLSAAVVAYALALSGSNQKQVAYDRLLSMAITDKGNNYLYWNTGNTAEDIETAGYGLLTLLLYDDMKNSSSVVNWLNSKQLISGEFKSTRDTIIALQSLSEFSTRAKRSAVNLTSTITSSRNARFSKVFNFNNDNALDVQEVIIEDPDGTIFVNTVGYGMGTLAMNLRYNVMKPEKEICKFDIEMSLVEVSFKNETDDNETEIKPKMDNGGNKKIQVLNLHMCVRYLGSKDAEMSIVDVGILSGFEPDVHQLDEFVKDPDHLIQMYEKSKRGVVFYLEKVPAADSYCFDIIMRRKYNVGKLQSSIIKVYDYYNPDAACTKFYSPDKKSPLLSTICESEVCECAEGGCPPENPFAKFAANPVARQRRQDIKTMFCDDFDYVWKGQLGGRTRKNAGLINVTFLVDEVIKSGVEAKEDVENNTRALISQAHCERTQFLFGFMYLIVGKNPPPRRINNQTHYRYMLDRYSIVYKLLTDDDKGNEQIIHDLEYVINQLKNEGCQELKS